jgi:hypothetical protein
MRLIPEARREVVGNSAHANALIPTAGRKRLTHICYSCERPPETATRCYSKQNEMAMA